jgi:WD40 repeat protein
MSTYILATGGYESTVRLFDAQNANMLRTIQFVDSQVLQLSFSGVGPAAAHEPLILAVAGCPRIALYDIQSASPSAFFVFEGHTLAVTAVGFEPSTRPAFVFSASEDGNLLVWDPHIVSDQLLLRHLELPNIPPHRLVLHHLRCSQGFATRMPLTPQSIVQRPLSSSRLM